MKRFVVSLSQTLLLAVLFALLVIQQLHEQPIIEKVLDSVYYPYTNGTSPASRSPTDHSFPYHSLNWSTSQHPLITPTSHQPNSHVSGKAPHLTFTPPSSQTRTADVVLRLEQNDSAKPLASTSALPETVAQVLQIDCNDQLGDPDSFAKAEQYVQSIMNLTESALPRLKCPTLNTTRYSGLHHRWGKPRYFFAMNLHQSAHVIPQLFGALVEAITILGPELCVISVVEGRSTDGTFDILKSLAKELEHMGVSYFFSCNDMQPGGDGMERISALAELRNSALKPLTSHPEQFDATTTLVFLNDIAPCAEDILELILQRVLLQADMTCGMDWYNLDDGEGGTFYDSWIGRQMNGE